MPAFPPVSDLNAAFAAVYGAPPPVVQNLKVPGDADESLAAEPVGLVPVGGGRFALIVRQANGMLSHSATGAASIAYVQRRSAGATASWRRVGFWPQIAFNGETGGDGMTLKVRHDLGPRPLVIMDAPTMFTGDGEDDVIVIRLDSDKPVPIGRVSLESSDDDATFDSHIERHRYTGHILSAKAPALFAVKYEGWRSEVGSNSKQRFRGVVRFGLRQGCLVALGRFPAPDIRPAAPAPSDCAQAQASVR